SADLMLLPFDEFDVILGMDWLTLHDALVNCKEKVIELKCENGEILRVEPDKSEAIFSMISSMSAQRYLRKVMKLIWHMKLIRKKLKRKLNQCRLCVNLRTYFQKNCRVCLQSRK
ncbi:hypothetical protein FGF76_23400, partial [Salmonella sp. gx-f4]|nr:hypothetical protein [Salmonella sp. gx-f4]